MCVYCIQTHTHTHTHAQQPAGRTTPGGHGGGEAYGNVSESVVNLQEALTRRTSTPVTSKILNQLKASTHAQITEYLQSKLSYYIYVEPVESFHTRTNRVPT